VRRILADERDASVAKREEVSGRDAAALDVVRDDHADVLTPRVDENDWNAGFFQAGQVGGLRWEREDEQPVRSIAPGQRGEVLIAVDGRFDVEENEVVAASRERDDHTAEAFDGRGVGEERDDDAEGLAPPSGQAASQWARPVVERLHRRND